MISWNEAAFGQENPKVYQQALFHGAEEYH